MARSPRPKNRILQKLPTPDYRQIMSEMELVMLPAGRVVCEPGEPLRYAHFPISSVLSSVIILEGGETVEVARIGNEGLAGLAILANSTLSPYRVVEPVQGEALRLSADLFRDAVKASRSLSRLVQRYTLARVHQSAQNAACNRHHNVMKRLSRWLSETAVRLGKDEFEVTQEYLAEMLGVRRQRINATARLLQDRGLIAYRHGCLTVLDRPALEAAACECLTTIEAVYEQMMAV